jgi:hypothetical protein
MIEVLKDVLLLVLSIGAVILWIRPDPEDDPDTVSVEYDCKKLPQYSSVPDEIIKECESIKGKNNVRQLDQ